MSSTQQNTDPSDPWLLAKAEVAALGRIPPVFTLAIRSLVSDYYRGNTGLSAASMFLVSRLLLSPTMKSVLYHAVLTFHSEKVTNTPHLTSADLVRLFSPEEVASLVATAYFFRTFKRKLHTPREESAWFDLEIRIHKELDLSGFVGNCISHIGGGISIASRIFPFLAQSFFLLKNPPGAAEHVSRLSIEGFHPDFEYESKTFGYSSAQLAASMMQAIGFGMPWMNAAVTMYSHMETVRKADPNLSGQCDPYYRRMHYASVWVEALMEECKEPTFKLPVDFYPAKQDLFKLLYFASELAEKGPKYSWVGRGKEDISPALTPQLYQEYLAESATSEELKSFCESNLPPEMLEDIPASEFDQITKPSRGTLDF